MTGWTVSSLLVLFACFSATHTYPSISTSTPTPCYGDVISLVCHHPEVASNPGRYFSQPIAWEENGVGINPTLSGSVFTAETAADHTRTTLTIHITRDHFRNKSFNYSCLLVLAKNGQPSGSETSENKVTVDPVDSPGKPYDITLTPDGANIIACWRYNKTCFEDHTFVFNLTWQKMGTANEFWSVVNGTAFNIPDLEPGNYSICVSAVSTSNVIVKSGQGCQTIYLKGNNTTAIPSIAVAAGVPSKEIVIFLPIVANMIAEVPLDDLAVAVVRLLDVAVTTVVKVVLLVVRVLVALICLVSIWQLFRRMQLKIERKTQASPVSEEQNGSTELVIDQGQHRANKDQTRTVSQTSCQRTTTDTDAELGFTGDGILPPSNQPREDFPSSKLDDSPPPDDDQGGSSGVVNSNSEREDFLTSVEEINPLPDDNYSQSEDLRTPVQETTRPSDVRYCAIIFYGHGKIIEKDYSKKKGSVAILHETSPPLADDNHVKHVFPRLINDNSESEDHPISVQESSPCDCGHEALNDQFRITQCDSITVSAQCMPSDIGGFLFSPFEYQLHDEKERICHEREEMSTSVQETQLPLQSTAASLVTVECLEEPLSEGPEMLPMAQTQSSYECPDVSKADASNINHELNSVSYEDTDVSNVQTSNNSKMPEVVSDCLCMSSGCQTCCAKESISSELVTEEGKVIKIPSSDPQNPIQSTGCPPEKQTSTFSEKIYGSLGGLETDQNPSQKQQNLRMLPGNQAESLQCMPKRTDVVYNDRGQSCCTFVPWLAYLFETVLHRIGALHVHLQIVGMDIAPY